MGYKKKKITDAEIKRLVVERLKTLPSGIKVSIGNDGSFNKEELIVKVKTGDSLGQKIIELELEYLRAFKKGEFFDESNASGNSAKL